MSREKVDKILRLSRNLENKPLLKKLFENGEVGYAKIEKIIYAVTPQTESLWAERLRTLPKSTLELCVQAERQKLNGRVTPRETNKSSQQTDGQNFRLGIAPGSNSQPEKMTSWMGQKDGTENFSSINQRISGKFNENQNLPEVSDDLATSKGERGPNWNHLSFPVAPTIELKLRQLKQKLERERGETVTFNEVLEKLFEMVERGAQAEVKGSKKGRSEPGKADTERGERVEGRWSGGQRNESEIQLCPDCIQRRERERSANHEVTRHIPMAVQRLVLARQQNRCTFLECTKPPEIFHHTRRFALKKSHDPNFIVALCKQHEGLLQAGLMENEEESPDQWKFREKAPWWDIKNGVDDKVAAFRGEGKT